MAMLASNQIWQSTVFRMFTYCIVSVVIIISVNKFLVNIAYANPQDPLLNDFRRQVWIAGTSYHRFFLESQEGRDFNRGNVAFNFGIGLIDRQWLTMAKFNLILGPYENFGEKDVSLDYYGNGFSIFSAYTIQRGGFRRPHGGFGVFFGLDYIDIVGRSVGTNQYVPIDTKENLDEPTHETIRGYNNQIYHFSFTTGIVLSKLVPPRRVGNAPELLKTTMEGVIVKMGIGLPLYSNHRTKYEKTLESQQIEAVSFKGPYRGHAYFISLIAPFGV